MTPDPAFMEAAIALSFEAMNSNRGGPYGAVVVKDGVIIGRGMNEVTSLNDPTAHAELTAIRQACATLNSWRLDGCELYTSCEPCPMCMAAVYWAQLDRVYYGNTREDAAHYGFSSQAIYEELARDRDSRKIAMHPPLPSKAITAFDAWANTRDREVY